METCRAEGARVANLDEGKERLDGSEGPEDVHVEDALELFQVPAALVRAEPDGDCMRVCGSRDCCGAALSMLAYGLHQIEGMYAGALQKIAHSSRVGLTWLSCTPALITR